MDCPCRARDAKALSYAQCCEPWHVGINAGKPAPTAEALMRSRYSAYALAKSNNAQGHLMLRYLLATWHTGTAPGEIELGPVKWIGLEVLDVQESTDAAVVEFNAYCRDNGKAQVLHEVSRFVKLGDEWKYLDGDLSAPRKS